MAKVKGPLMSMEASGQVGSTVVFSRWKGTAYVRRHAVPSNPQTANQIGVRVNFKGTVAAYKALTVGNQTLWKTIGAALSLTGLNAMMRQAQVNLQALFGIQQLPTRVNNTPPAVPTASSVSVSGNRATYIWTDPADADLYLIYLYRSTPTGFTPGPDNLVGIVAKAVETFSEVLPVGVYYCKGKACDVDGNLGTAWASITVTIV